MTLNHVSTLLYLTLGCCASATLIGMTASPKVSAHAAAVHRRWPERMREFLLVQNVDDVAPGIYAYHSDDPPSSRVHLPSSALGHLLGGQHFHQQPAAGIVHHGAIRSTLVEVWTLPRLSHGVRGSRSPLTNARWLPQRGLNTWLTGCRPEHVETHLKLEERAPNSPCSLAAGKATDRQCAGTARTVARGPGMTLTLRRSGEAPTSLGIKLPWGLGQPSLRPHQHSMTIVARRVQQQLESRYRFPQTSCFYLSHPALQAAGRDVLHRLTVIIWCTFSRLHHPAGTPHRQSRGRSHRPPGTAVHVSQAMKHAALQLYTDGGYHACSQIVSPIRSPGSTGSSGVRRCQSWIARERP